MSEHRQPDELDDELARLAAEPLRVEAVDTETGQRLSGTIFRDHLDRPMPLIDNGEPIRELVG